MSVWNATNAKAQLRLAASRLGQLQSKNESHGQITRRDIATLLQQGNVELARAKAQNLINDDTLSDLYEILEMYIGAILEHFKEIENRVPPTPAVAEAASNLIFAAPQTELKELATVHEILVFYFGSDFTRSALSNRDGHVSKKVIKLLSAPPPTAARLNNYLVNIATTYRIQWKPELSPQEVLRALSEIMEPTTAPVVDLPRLRHICSHGIPDDPSWLRPRIWKLLFGILPVLKASWQTEMDKHRESYYHLIRRLLSSLSESDPPGTATDKLIMECVDLISRVPLTLFSGLEEEPETSQLCPLHDDAPSDLKIPCATILDERFRHIRDSKTQDHGINVVPDIRLDAPVPEISLSEPEPTESFASKRPGAPTTLLSRSSIVSGGAHAKHGSALLRLLYVHLSLNPANQSPYIPSLLVLLYSVMCKECELEELAHAEADTFWIFEALVNEVSELEDESTSKEWTQKLSKRLAWADPDLSASLQTKGLDPALPHYSYRWLAPLLTQTLPVPSVLMAWDAIFTFPSRERNLNPKLEHLVDICASLLIRARAPLFRLGKPGTRSPGLWAEEQITAPPPSPLRSWEYGDAFLEGMSLLQVYPLDAAGGIERILQTASDLARRRHEEMKTPSTTDNRTLGARLTMTMWKGFTNQTSPDGSPNASPYASDEEEEEEEEEADSAANEDGNDTETPQTNGTLNNVLSSRVVTAVWKGITNQNNEEPPSPIEPLSPLPPPSPTKQSQLSPTISVSPAPSVSPPASPASPALSIWSYAEKIRDSDTAASWAKTGSNWKARALSAWSGRGSTSEAAADNVTGSPGPSRTGAASGHNPSLSSWSDSGILNGRRDSIPSIHASSYTPPPRPAYFRPPRDSWMPPPREAPSISEPDEDSPKTESTSISNVANNIQASLASLTGLHTSSPSPKPKSGPRPLLLGSSTTMVTGRKSLAISRSATNTPQPNRMTGQWGDVMRARGHAVHRDSQSSISSLSPSDIPRPGFSRQGSGWNSDSANGRRVPINRRNVSPMAPHFNLPSRRGPGSSSSGTMSDRGLLSPPALNDVQLPENRGWGQVNLQDDSLTPSQSSVNRTAPAADHATESLDESITLEAPPPPRRIARKKTPPPQQSEAGDTSESDAASHSPLARNSKRPQRLANLKINPGPRRASSSDLTPSPGNLGIDWPERVEDATTPRAAAFEDSSNVSTSPRKSKASLDSQEARTRKVSGRREQPNRKLSGGSVTQASEDEISEVSRKRESSAIEGDDEGVSGYDDVLSAYESEELSEDS